MGTMRLLEIAVKGVIYIAIGAVGSKLITKAFDKQTSNLIHVKFLKNLIIGVIWMAIACGILSQFSAFTQLANTILAGSGILAVILGLAAQESFSNLFSGLFISVFKPFNIGDRILISGEEYYGFVEDITLRHTIIRTYTNVRLIIPNSKVGNSTIQNSTYSNGASYPIEVDIAYEDSAKRHRAVEILEEVIMNHPLFYDARTYEQRENNEKPVRALCTDLGASGIHLKCLMWTEKFSDNARACSEVRMELLDKLEAEGIEVTYNKLEIVNKHN